MNNPCISRKLQSRVTIRRSIEPLLFEEVIKTVTKMESVIGELYSTTLGTSIIPKFQVQRALHSVIFNLMEYRRILLSISNEW